MTKLILFGVAAFTVLAAVSCEPGLSKTERTLSALAGHREGYAIGSRLPHNEGVYWVNPDNARKFNLADYQNKAIPKYYVRPEDYTKASRNEQRALADSYNWGFFCGFMVGAGEWQDAANKGCLEKSSEFGINLGLPPSVR